MKEKLNKIWQSVVSVVIVIELVILLGLMLYFIMQICEKAAEREKEMKTFQLTSSYNLVQMDYELNENIRTSKKTDVVFLLLYVNVSTTVDEDIYYEDRYTYWYKRDDGGIIKENITIPEDSDTRAVFYPLKEGEKPKLEVYYKERWHQTEYRFYLNENTILELYGVDSTPEQEKEDTSKRQTE